GRLTDDRGVPLLAAPSRPFEQLDGTVDGGAFLVAGDQQRDRALERALFGDVTGDGCDEAGNAALHVDRAAPVHETVGYLGGKGWMRPCRLVANRHDVGVTGEHQVRAVAGQARVEVLDVRRT